MLTRAQVYAKKSYGRGAGVPLGCGNQQYDAGLCYDPCKMKFSGVGPVCWIDCPLTVNSQVRKLSASKYEYASFCILFNCLHLDTVSKTHVHFCCRDSKLN